MKWELVYVRIYGTCTDHIPLLLTSECCGPSYRLTSMRHSISLVLVVMIEFFINNLCRVLMKEIFELKMKKADKAEINERKIQVTSWTVLE